MWLANARHANAMGARLEAALAARGVWTTRPRHSNAVFVSLPRDVIRILHKQYDFYVWREDIQEVRLMTSFETSETDVDAFAAAITHAQRSAESA